MNARIAVGFVETRGLVGAIEAADAAVKAADVGLLGFQQAGDGLVSIRFSGDVAAVHAAVLTAVEAAGRVGEVISHSIIPAPHRDVRAWFQAPEEALTPQSSTGRERKRSPSVSGSHPDELARLSVARLRTMVRQMPDARLKGRQVSRADKAALLAELRRLGVESAP